MKNASIINECLDEVFTAIMQTFRFTAEEQEQFTNNQIARLIGAIPFAADCEDAKRTALAHIAVYMTELRGGAAIGAHTEEDNDSVFLRLRLLSSFKDGDEKIINHGMTLLALVMLESYQQSRDYDAQHNQYNPLNDNAWDYEELKSSLVDDIKKNPCAVLDDIMPVDNILRYW